MSHLQNVRKEDDNKNQLMVVLNKKRNRLRWRKERKLSKILNLIQEWGIFARNNQRKPQNALQQPLRKLLDLPPSNNQVNHRKLSGNRFRSTENHFYLTLVDFETWSTKSIFTWLHQSQGLYKTLLDKKCECNQDRTKIKNKRASSKNLKDSEKNLISTKIVNKNGKIKRNKIDKKEKPISLSLRKPSKQNI